MDLYCQRSSTPKESLAEGAEKGVRNMNKPKIDQDEMNVVKETTNRHEATG